MGENASVQISLKWPRNVARFFCVATSGRVNELVAAACGKRRAVWGQVHPERQNSVWLPTLHYARRLMSHSIISPS